MGTSLPNGSELDDATFRRASRLLVEWKPQSLVEAGEVVQALSAGVLSNEADVVDFAQLYRNEAPVAPQRAGHCGVQVGGHWPDRCRGRLQRLAGCHPCRA
jgi:ornithine cyclodeaminase/alanine dehydrogenase-like protein (mu-crystallin family)